MATVASKNTGNAVKKKEKENRSFPSDILMTMKTK
jgi:hypothetical protein